MYFKQLGKNVHHNDKYKYAWDSEITFRLQQGRVGWSVAASVQQIAACPCLTVCQAVIPQFNTNSRSRFLQHCCARCDWKKFTSTQDSLLTCWSSVKSDKNLYTLVKNKYT